MIEHLVKRGYTLGSGLLSPDSQRFIVSIPKNASSYIADWATKNNWSMINLDSNNNVNEVIVILRDPVDRWISGITQYINTYILSVHGPNGPIFNEADITEHDYYMSANMLIDQYNQLSERLLFDVISLFDDHVYPQHEFIKDLLPNVPRTYFYIDSTVNNRIGNYLGFEPYNNLDSNASENNAEMKVLQKFFKQRLIERPELRKRLAKHYEEDYNLIAQVIK